MKKLLTICVILISMMMIPNIWANNCPDIIKMKNENAFDSHRMPIITFDHKYHINEINIKCGDCHHDDKGNSLSKSDNMMPCFNCHSGTGAGTPKAFMAPLTNKDVLDSYYNTIHINCVGCHKQQNGPVACNQCHIK